MVNELFLTAAQSVAVFYGISPANMVYLLSFMFSTFLGIVSGVATKNKVVGFSAFVGFLFIFAIMDAFPLWILAMATLIGGVLYWYMAGRE